MDFATLNSGEEADLPPVRVTTQSGVVLTADLAYACAGIIPNTQFLSAEEKIEHTTDLNHWMLVNSSLQSTLGPHIFCCGDVMSFEEEKLAQSAKRSATITITNILQSAHNRLPLAEYSSPPLPVVISLGKHDAIFTWRGFSFGGFLPALIKEAVEWKVLASF